MPKPLAAPFPYFGGKRKVLDLVWERLGKPKQYIEPFCGSAAMLLGSPHRAILEVVGDMNGFIANFWRAVKHQPEAVARHADYPVSHIDLGARHRWLMEQRERIAAELTDANHPGDAKVAGWWLWGQCAWIGSGWCDWFRDKPVSNDNGQIPFINNAGMGVQAIGAIPANNNDHGLMTSGGRAAWEWLHCLADRIERVRVIHGSWDRCLNTDHGRDHRGTCAVFLDPPYGGHGGVYGSGQSVLLDVIEWCRERGALQPDNGGRKNPNIRIALCGHRDDYELPGWTCANWKRASNTYASTKTRDKECIWFSPACLKPQAERVDSIGPLWADVG